jgi:hypothetical protein
MIFSKDKKPTEPDAWAVTFNGEVNDNLFTNRDEALSVLQRMDKKHPDGVRTIAPLYREPPDTAALRKRVGELEIGLGQMGNEIIRDHDAYGGIIKEAIDAVGRAQFAFRDDDARRGKCKALADKWQAFLNGRYPRALLPDAGKGEG